MRSHKLYFVSTVDQAEEEKTPSGSEGGRGHTQVYYDPTVKQAEEKKTPNGCESG